MKMTNHMTTPMISRALVQNPRYVAEFGRVEADVLLQFEGSAKSVKVVTSVAARTDEGFESLYLRLTQDAARLWRLLETHAMPVVNTQAAA